MFAVTRIVSDISHQPLVSVGPGASVAEAVALATARDIHHVPILQGHQLLGIVCTCDLGGAPRDLRVLQLARRNVVTVEPECTVQEAARLMIANIVGSLLVRSRNGQWGIVTRSDLLQSHADVESLLSELHCAVCGATRHLFQNPGNGYVCAPCAEQARAHHWFDRRSSD